MSNALKFYINGAWVDPVTPGHARCHQSGDGRSLRQDLRRLRGRCRPRGRRGAGGLSRLLPDQQGGAPAAAAADPRDLQGARSRTSRAPSPTRWARRWAWRAMPRPAPARAHLESTIKALESFEFEQQRGGTRIVQRADRRRRPDHALELAAEPDRLQGGAGARRRLHHGAEAERDRADQRHRLRRDHARGRRAARASSTWSTATGPRSARPSPPIPASTWCPSPARRAPASSSPRPPPTRSSASRRSWAASRPTSSWPTPISRRPSRKGVEGCFSNSGQSCNAPTRMLVPREPPRRGAGHRQEGGGGAEGRRSQGGGHDARPGGQRDPVRQDPAPDPGRHRGGRHPGHRRHRPARGPQPRLLRAPDRVRRRDATT